jgi:tol-pal system protein YbgF
MISVFAKPLGVALLASVSFWPLSGAFAEDASELADRLGRMEEQVRQLVGQVEELTYELRETRGEIARIKGASHDAVKAKKKAIAAGEPVPFEDGVTGEPLPKPAKKKFAAASAGKEQITDTAESAAAISGEEFAGAIVDENGIEQPVKIKKAPKPKVLGILPGSAGEFEGDEIEPEGGAAAKVETVALGADETLDSPEKLYERSYESLLRRQFSEAEGGFRGFLSRHREHSLAGNAQYWLGETFYVQGEYKQAAQFFLTGFEEFPKSRKAADSLVKLGMSLNRLGQRDQACAAFAAVPDRFPKATEAKKRAAAEQKRGKC